MTNLRKTVFVIFTLLSVIIVISQVIFYNTRLTKSPSLQIIYEFLREDKSEEPVQQESKVKVKVGSNSTTKKYLVNTASCKIPYIHPLDKSITPYFKFDEIGTISCSQELSLTYVVDDVVFINKTIATTSYNNTINKCEADDIVRLNVSDNRMFYINKRIIHKSKGAALVAEFTRVRCFNFNQPGTNIVYVNVHAKIVPKSDADERFNDSFPSHSEKYDDSFNVLLIGIDTVSGANFERYANKTRNVLLDTFEAVQLLGYTIIGENTFPNVVALLSGKFAVDLPWSRTMANNSFDRYKFIFKEYSTAGYSTMYVEDDPVVSTFNYLKPGFTQQPADYYFRPMALTLNKYNGKFWKNNNCIYDKTEQEVILDYVYKFVEQHDRDGRPFFGFVLNTRLTHGSMMDAVYLDSIHLPFLERIAKDNRLKNTFLIYFSDHGYRHGSFRQTQAGGFEARLPLLYISPPQTFKIKYPDLWANLQDNAKILTSPFDLHATLRDILYLKSEQVEIQKDPTMSGLSLLRKIPERSCYEAGIPYHWCACPQKTRISADILIVQQAARYYVDYLNALLINKTKVCAMLTLSNVTEAYEIMDIKSSFYRITIVTVPGNAVYEASVIPYANGTFSTSREISRMTLYGNTSWCVHDSQTRMICYCKVQKQPNDNVNKIGKKKSR